MYFFCIQIVGWIKRKETPGKAVKPKKRFALVAAAHNEELVIEELVDSLKNLDYPKDMYDIFIIADNCTDKTAEIATKGGAVCYERSDAKNKSKGYKG